jgi:hypothetical protein
MNDLIITREQSAHEQQFCKDPAFYVWDANAHQLVAQVSCGDRTISVFCDGELRLHVWASKEARIDNANYQVIRYSDRLAEAGIETDEQLQKALDEERIEFENNSWFDLYADDDSVGDAGWLNCVHFDVEEAILQASELITDEEWAKLGD